MFARRAACFALAALLPAAGCGGGGPADDGAVLARDGEPDVVFTDDDDAEMNRAKAEAKRTYRQFVAALAAAPENPDMTGFTVKRPFADADGGAEHIWIGDVAWDGERFAGRLANDPVAVPGLSYGDPVTADPDEISDWMYFDGDRMVGGYTVRVLHWRLPPEDRAAFEAESGMTVPAVDF